MTLIIGVIGALVGGALFNYFGRSGATGITLYSILVATVGAVVFLWVWKMLAGRRTA
ncbi:MAG TPA: GlsB/YeaQ/YmgE family stress response membrane protein [bacterium]|nr:GlsB/YeaQ/YmgE family stress response membrane protein [bacterium]